VRVSTSWAATTIRMAIRKAGQSPNSIGVLNHSTGPPMYWVRELVAM